ncbi:LAME_0F16754g1_1 [Lachancea meyersii CBS 8951]|uniref:Pre-rRNA-processing protein IPI3 n=1 Tax=Lachancea meyersii CBS 8951 TaxID=1266667 RepID=A0A1G4JZL9_9SACH|nr:LAME_0F16754g1_1 [Lachancea meyersii CBS 8951]
MEEQLCFSTSSTCTVAILNGAKQTDLKQCGTEFRNGTVRVGYSHLFVAQRRKAVINVYKINGNGSRESVEQRLALPEPVSCLEVVENAEKPDTPYLLLASTPTGKLFVWELMSGNLLAVKPLAHYQPITKIQSVVNGKYVITSGADARLMIWQTVDLVTQQDPKPIFTLHDHTLGITDFCVSNAHAKTHLSGKLFTVSQDMTLRCYDLNLDVWPQPQLLATFTFPSPLECIALDPADRACYVGGPQGVYQVNFYYSISSNQILNLLNADGNRIISCVECQPERNLRELYAMGQIECPKILDASGTQLAISMDGSSLVVGDTSGKCSVIDVYSKQSMKEIQSIVVNESCGEVTGLTLNLIDQDTSESLVSTDKAHTEFKFPNLQKSVFTREGLHDVYYQAPAEKEGAVAPLDDFEEYLDQVASEENAFVQLGSVVSTVKIVDQIKSTAEGTQAQDEPSRQEESKEILEMQENVRDITNAYKDLREMYDKLLREHQTLSLKSEQ